MKQIKMLAKGLGTVLLAVSLAGCAKAPEDTKASRDAFEITQEQAYQGPVSMESAPVMDYRVPEIVPNLLVNRVGYSAEGRKSAVIVGDDLPVQFSLVEVGTQEAVYQGMIEQISFDEEQQRYLGRAVFDDFRKTGNYYVKCELLGESYPFLIQEELYQQLFLENYQELQRVCKQKGLEAEELAVFLTAYEWYPELFPDEDENEIPDILETVKEGFSMEEGETEEKGKSLYAAVLAKLGYLYQNIDSQQAARWTQQAVSLLAGAARDEASEPDYFYALTELYRVTGWNTYRYQIIEYTDFFEKDSSYLEESSYLYGAMTYLVTKQRVSVPLCNILYGDIETQGERIENSYENRVDFSENAEEDREALFLTMQQLFCCDSLLKHSENTQMAEALFNFSMGQNMTSVSLEPEVGERSVYMLLLAQLAAENMDEG